ncbi:MAG: hypothetical protein GY744_18345 [Gammaproteobacteria bacterium]|nr:hypothetical protein [Gammaproteobacteria bacterium]
MEIEDLNLPVRISQFVVEQLKLVGISLPLLWTQLLVLVLCLAASYFFIQHLRQKEDRDLPSILITIAFVLFALGILYSWLDNRLNPLPGEVTGQITILDREGRGRFNGLYVELIDFNDQNIAREKGIIDSRNGFFALTYKPDFADYPRFIRVSGNDCLTTNHPLTRSALLSGDTINLKMRCKE